MPTDRVPFEYRYLSGRLLVDLFRHDEAARAPWKLTGGVNVRLANLQASRTDLDHANLHALAVRSEQLVSDQTGMIELTGAGLYVRDRLDMHHHVFEPHMGWTGGAVVSCSGEVVTGEGERIFVALFGSASNVVGFRDPGGTGFYPSGITGLYTMLDLAREPTDPEIDFEYRWDDGHLSPDALAHNAIKFSRGRRPRHIGEHDFLARIFIDVDDHRYGDEFEGQVIMGAPLWVAPPADRSSSEAVERPEQEATFGRRFLRSRPRPDRLPDRGADRGSHRDFVVAPAKAANPPSDQRPVPRHRFECREAVRRRQCATAAPACHAIGTRPTSSPPTSPAPHAGPETAGRRGQPKRARLRRSAHGGLDMRAQKALDARMQIDHDGGSQYLRPAGSKASG